MQGYRAFSRNDELLVPFRTWRNNITAQLAGYVHWKLPGVRVPGLGDASGMFPIDNNADSLGFDKRRIALYDAHIADRGGSWKLGDILPRTVQVGEIAGRLSEEGAALLDPGGALRPGIPLAPPEDDAATGMAATNTACVCGPAVFRPAPRSSPCW